MPPGNFQDPRRPRERYPEIDRVRWEPLFPPPEGMPDPRLIQGRRGRPSVMPGIIALVLLCFGVGIAYRFFGEISMFFSMIGTLADRPTEREAFLGLAAFGISLVAILAVLKIVLSSRSGRR